MRTLAAVGRRARLEGEGVDAQTGPNSREITPLVRGRPVPRKEPECAGSSEFTSVEGVVSLR